jgi:hypothetical protein
MKYSLFLILLFVGLSIRPALAQKTVFGPHVADDSREFLIDGTCDDFWFHPVGTHYPPYAPRFLYRHDSNGLPDKEARYIVDWLLPNDSTYAPAISVTLRIEYYGNNLPDPTVEAWAFSSLSSQMNDATIISGMSGSPLFTMTGSNGVIVHSVTSGAFLNTVNSAVQAGHLTLAFELPAQTGLFDHCYLSDSTAFQLTIQFQDSIAIKITNVVNGTVDYDLEPESLVRGDINLFIGNEADYAQLPAFEPAYVTRDWRVLFKHIAETWFTKFDDVSLPCRMKFREWDGNNDLYKVMYLTPEFDGVQTEFQAIADSTVPARHKAKREITHSYDGLPITFRDPWRVEQTLIGGVPSSQTVIDTYQDQTTPYEPWNDSQSLGVFLNQPTNNTLHYGAHYWRYYHYDGGGDSYDKKDDLPLSEGDLINMDEILLGAGAEVSPSGGIEFLRSSASGVPYLEYRLEYKDPLNTMDFTGIYKAHLLSDKEGQPTRSANQRKIDIDPRGVYHMVYESAGEVWYTQSEDGTTWSPEELVSGYSHNASNASLAVLDSSVYVTFMEDAQVMLMRRYKGVWYDHQLHDNYGDNNGAATTPVVAAGHQCLDPYGNPKGDIVLVIWDHAQYIEYNLLWLYFTQPNIQQSGVIADNDADPPVFPTIDSDNEFIQFTAAWREGTRIRAKELRIPTCNQAFFYLAEIDLPDVSFDYEIAVHAPSITHDNATKPVVAYEVKVPSLIYSDRWVNVRTFDETTWDWNTTLYQIPYYQFTQYSDPIAPSVGAHQTTTMCGQMPEPGLRLAFHQNWGGGIRVGVIDCQYSEYDQLSNGESFPSVVPFAPNGLLREAFSAPYQVGPFMHAIRTTNDYLTKQMTPDITLVRDLRLRIGDDLALFGVTGLSVRRGSQTVDEVSWYALPDTLVIGVDGEPHELLRSEAFTLADGNRIEYRNLVYCSDAQAMPGGVSLSLQVRKASDHSVILSYALPLRTLASDTAMWGSWSRVIAQAPSYPVYLSLGVDGVIPVGAELSTAKVWLEDQYIPKATRTAGASTLPTSFILERNHPNPFNPGTRIPFALGEDGHVLLTVHDALGREVARLVDETLPAGRHLSHFDASGLPSGTYVARLQFGGLTQSRNMMLIK